VTGDYLLAGKTTFLLWASSPPQPTLSSADAGMPLLGYSLVTSGNTPLFTQIKKQIAVQADF